MGTPKPKDLSAGESIVVVSGVGTSPDGLQEDAGQQAAGLDQGGSEANIVRMTDEERHAHAEGMASEELAKYIAKRGWGDVLAKLVQLKSYIQVLWGRFEDLNDGETIAGCRTKEEFCEKCLNRSIRAVQYMLYGRTPRKPSGARSGEQRQSEAASDSANGAASAAEAADGASDDPNQAGDGGSSRPGDEPRIDRDEFERAKRVAAPAVSLAAAVMKDGLGSKFPQAAEILKAADIPVPAAPPATATAQAEEGPDWKSILTGLVATLELHREGLHLNVVSALRFVSQYLDREPKPKAAAPPGSRTKRRRVPKTAPASPLPGRTGEGEGETAGAESEREGEIQQESSDSLAGWSPAVKTTEDASDGDHRRPNASPETLGCRPLEGEGPTKEALEAEERAGESGKSSGKKGGQPRLWRVQRRCRRIAEAGRREAGSASSPPQSKPVYGAARCTPQTSVCSLRSPCPARAPFGAMQSAPNWHIDGTKAGSGITGPGAVTAGESQGTARFTFRKG